MYVVSVFKWLIWPIMQLWSQANQKLWVKIINKTRSVFSVKGQGHMVLKDRTNLQTDGLYSQLDNYSHQWLSNRPSWRPDFQTNRWTGQWTDRSTEKLKTERDRQTDWWTDGGPGWRARWVDGWTDRQTDRQTDHQNDWCQLIPWPWKLNHRHQNRHPVCFSSKVMVQNVFLRSGGEHNTPVFGQHTDCRELQD